jgi:hypothetical protein
MVHATPEFLGGKYPLLPTFYASDDLPGGIIIFEVLKTLIDDLPKLICRGLSGLARQSQKAGLDFRRKIDRDRHKMLLRIPSKDNSLPSVIQLNQRFNRAP